MSLCSVLRRVTFCCLRSLHVLPPESARVTSGSLQMWCLTIATPHFRPSGQRTQRLACLAFAEAQPITRFSKCELEDLLLHVVAWIPLRGAFEERWKIFVGKLWSFRNYFVSLPTSIADTSLKRCWPHGAWFPERRVAVRFLREKKEALCSSCKLKPKKFHVRQENMMTSTYRRGMLSYLPYQVSQDLNL